jgi:hypothetical protein
MFSLFGFIVRWKSVVAKIVAFYFTELQTSTGIRCRLHRLQALMASSVPIGELASRQKCTVSSLAKVKLDASGTFLV